MRYRIQTKKKSTEKPAPASSPILNRPFAQPTQASPTLQTKPENAENFGHNFANIPVLNPQTEAENSSPPTIQLKGAKTKEKNKEQDQPIYYMDEQGVAHNQPAPYYMDEQGVAHNQPAPYYMDEQGVAHNNLPIIVDPQGNAFTMSDEECKNIIKANDSSWTEVKTKFKDQESTMWELWSYRKRYVDQLINQLRKKYPGLISKSVGSKDRESDYDITISSPGTDNDVKAVAEFNNIVKSEFGKQPGTVFDTNLYAKDYLKVEENIDDTAKNDTQGTDKDLDQPEQSFSQTSNLDQDVAALVKQRRYMNPVEWDNYLNSVLTGINNKQERKAVVKQYEEADAIFQIAAYDLLEECRAAMKEKNLDLQSQPKLSEQEQKAVDASPSASRNILAGQLLAIEELHEITSEQPDLVLEKSNQLYLERMTKVRQIQAEISKLEQSQNPEAAADQINVLKAEVKKLLGEACFFASEAYHSEGAVKHVVAGLQGKDSQAALAKLTPIDILQSFNEQLGDFLKDIVHYTHEDAPDGKTFYRSSKYLYRLFDAVIELRKRPDFNDMKLQIENTKPVEDMAKIVKGELLAVRKGEKTFNSEEEKLAHCEKVVNDLFKVKTAEGLKQVVLNMSSDFNQKVRNKLSFTQDKEESKKYFQYRQ
ncbi:hypothetical protein NG798_00325 [Ancylothrix sp. C2]|uniref:hypothetical protein n=1 Tax=Ancylothrix sp. D3o TaxID=2953691 RepID=UPI0021BB4860|nr:hypothetical protein [Ancylothrix sp. D3o]MCT7948237.1 hypothetical protein [Ancylothrix sp. D3o]